MNKKVKIDVNRIITILLVLALCLSVMSCAEKAKIPMATEVPTASPMPTPEPLTVDRLATLSSMEFSEPKNVILMIGDGMGFAHIKAALSIQGTEFDGKLAMEYLPNKGQSITASLDGHYDSAACGTALATGHKTNLYRVGMDYKDNEIKNLTELAREKGKLTGVITTTILTDATPADFTVHVKSRYGSIKDIVRQQIEHCPDLLFGGGRSTYDENMDDELTQLMMDNNITRVTEWEEVANVTSGKILGTFHPNWDTIDRVEAGFAALAEEPDDTLWNANDTPKLSQMTAYALDHLSKGENGFFLMIEGGNIDEHSHLTNMIGMTQHLKEFDNSVALVISFLIENPDTVLIVTADHETGAVMEAGKAEKIVNANKSDINVKSVTDNLKKHAKAREDAGLEIEPTYEYGFSTIAHSAGNVPVFAVGYGTEIFNDKKVKEFEIGKFLGMCLGEPEFGSSAATGR